MSNSNYIVSLASKIHRKGLSAAAIFLLESSKPLFGVGAEMVSMFRPLLVCMVGASSVDQALSVLNDKNAVDQLISSLEDMASLRET